MAVWVIGDTHLSGNQDKPMGIFGPNWENHQARLAENWSRLVGPEDCVIVAGDISWALQPSDAVADLRFLHELPGRRKILLRGNHDYWWTTRSKVEKLFADESLTTLQIFQNEALLLDEAESPTILVGSRGWKLPGEEDFGADDRKIFQRELERLKMSLRDAEKRAVDCGALAKVAVTHYPPLSRDGQSTEVSSLLEAAGVSYCYYGHVHGHAGRTSFNGEARGIRYRNVACDQVDCTPVQMA